MIRINGIDEESEKRINRQYFMKDKKDYFDLSPRIVPSGKVSTLTVQGKDKLIKLEGEYLVMIIPYYEFEFIPFEDYHDRLQKVTAINGRLEIPYLFSSEQMYRVIIGEQCDGETGQLLKSTVYALDEDLFHLKPLIGDFHSHTIHSDGFDTPEQLLHAAIRHKLDFVAVTDHNNYHGSVAAAAIAEEQHLPITVINGEEYSSSFTNMHIISLGAAKPLEEKYYNFQPENGEKPLSVFEYTKQLCERIRENGGLSVMCHPLWKPFHKDGSRIDVPMSLVRDLMKSAVFDAIEIVGGSPEEDLMTSQMVYMWAMGYGALPGTVAYLGSTDSHTYTIDPICGNHFTFVMAKENTQQAVIESIRNKRTVAAQVVDSKNVLLYGEPRYCMFAQFYIRDILERIE